MTMRCFCAIATLVCLLWFGQNLNAQTKADSLKSLLQRYHAPDTARVRLLVDYAWELRKGDLEERIRVLKEAMDLSRQLKFIKGIGDVEMQLGNCWQSKADYPKAKLSDRKSVV